MTSVRIPDIGTVNFPDTMSHDDIVRAIETDIMPNRARYGVQARAQSPPPSRFGDPNAPPPASAFEQAMPMLAHPVDAVSGALSAVNPSHALQHPLDAATSAVKEIVGTPDSQSFQARRRVLDHPDLSNPETWRDMVTGSIPLLGAALTEAGRRMTSPDPHEAARGSGAAVALTSGPAMVRGAGRGAGALTESLGSRLAGAGKLPIEEIPVQKFKSAAAQSDQLAALKDKYPDAEVADSGDSFTVRRVKSADSGPASIDEQARQQFIRDNTPPRQPGARGAGLGVASLIARHPVSTAAGAAIGSVAGHPWLGAEVGYAAGELATRAQQFLKSPQFKLASAPVKRAVGNAMLQGDYALVANIAARMTMGVGLADSYGHDTAIHGLLNELEQRSAGNPDLAQHLVHDYEAYYEQPDGTRIKVPYNVTQQTHHAITSTATNR